MSTNGKKAASQNPAPELGLFDVFPGQSDAVFFTLVDIKQQWSIPPYTDSDTPARPASCGRPNTMLAH